MLHMNRPSRIVRYIDKGAVAQAQAELHHQERTDWAGILGWLAAIVGMCAFWYWALLC